MHLNAGCGRSYIGCRHGERHLHVRDVNGSHVLGKPPKDLGFSDLPNSSDIHQQSSNLLIEGRALRALAPRPFDAGSMKVDLKASKSTRS
jgi:hypothetical protein